MENKKTTIGGYILIGAAVLNVIGTFLVGGDMDTALKAAAAMVVGGGALVGAADGGR